ncbi:GAF domain-containing protein [Flaviflagellibacter deserti]|uniref:GAF domain-containing protein n=1 Tax=Flaviflagellibacter deserti TaxID=2267266 RepID=A0ABV9Z1Y4_9HYPH
MNDNRFPIVPELEAILRTLMAETGAMRCTVRVDHPAAALSVNVPCAEVLAPGGVSMMGNFSADHRRALTVRRVEATRTTLIQGDVFADPALAPPPALVQEFGTKAQMVAPLIGDDDYLFGWVSAHFAEGPRVFSDADIAAMERARQAVLGLSGLPVER